MKVIQPFLVIVQSLGMLLTKYFYCVAIILLLLPSCIPSLPLLLLSFHFLLLITMAQNQNRALIKVAQHQDQVLTGVGLDQVQVNVDSQ